MQQFTQYYPPTTYAMYGDPAGRRMSAGGQKMGIGMFIRPQAGAPVAQETGMSSSRPACVDPTTVMIAWLAAHPRERDGARRWYARHGIDGDGYVGGLRDYLTDYVRMTPSARALRRRLGDDNGLERIDWATLAAALGERDPA